MVRNRVCRGSCGCFRGWASVWHPTTFPHILCIYSDTWSLIAAGKSGNSFFPCAKDGNQMVWCMQYGLFYWWVSLSTPGKETEAQRFWDIGCYVVQLWFQPPKMTLELYSQFCVLFLIFSFYKSLLQWLARVVLAIPVIPDCLRERGHSFPICIISR
jgi:hypothetical protein